MNPNLAEDNKATRFSSTHRPKNKVGRKPSKWKAWTKEYDIGAEEQVRVAQMILAVKTREDIEALIQRKDVPFGVWAAAMAALKDASKGGGGFLTKLYEMAFGKIPDKLIAMTEDLTYLTKEERDAEIKRIYQDHFDPVRGGGDATAGSADGSPGRAQETEQEEPGTPEEADHD